MFLVAWASICLFSCPIICRLLPWKRVKRCVEVSTRFDGVDDQLLSLQNISTGLQEIKRSLHTAPKTSEPNSGEVSLSQPEVLKANQQVCQRIMTHDGGT